MSAIKWYCQQENDSIQLKKTIKNILTKCTIKLLEQNIRIQGKKLYEWYLENENDDTNKIELTQRILSQCSNMYVSEFCQYILTKDESIIVSKSKGGKKRDNYPFIAWYIDYISDNIVNTKYRDTINNILTKCDRYIIQKLLVINIDNNTFLEWYISNTKIAHDLKFEVIKCIISKCEDNTIINLIQVILEHDNQSVIRLIQGLMSIKVSNGDTVFQWYFNLSNDRVNNSDRVTEIDNIIYTLDNDKNIAEVIKCVLDTNNPNLIVALRSQVTVQGQQAIKWYLGNHNVTHNDKVTAANAIISTLGNNKDNIAEVIKYIIDTNNPNLIVALRSQVTVQGQQAIKWYLGNHNVTHNDKVTAINSIIPIFEDDNILTIIKDILTADNLNLIDALGREVTIHNKPAMKWYLSSVNHIEIIQHIEKIISLYNQTSDATLYDVIDCIITHCDQLLLKELDTKTTY